MCDQWNGRIFAQNGACGAKGEECTMTEFNLDTGNNFTPQESLTLHLSIPGSLTSFSGLWYIEHTGKYTIMSKHPHTNNPWSSDLQGFTQSISIAVNGCDTVTCTNVNCGCSSAYPPGVSAIGFARAWFAPTCVQDLSGCGNDSPVRGCSAGDHSWTITFCPWACQMP